MAGWDELGQAVKAARWLASLAMVLLFSGTGLRAGTAPRDEHLSPADTVIIHERSGHTQTNRPVTIPRAFRQGEIAHFAEASLDGKRLLTQCDVKNRWPDGSLKYAMVSFVVPTLQGHGSAVVSFGDQPGGHNEEFLDQAGLLNDEYDFEAGIEMAGATTQKVSAREMVEQGAFRYWLKGPVVTAVIVEDRTPARRFDRDFGDGSRALHPIFEAWFYPASKSVEVGCTVENIWASSDRARALHDLSYGLKLWAGAKAPKVTFQEPTFTHIARSRWHKRFWVGTPPAAIQIDHNFAYWTSTHAIANWDTSIRPTGALLASRLGADSSTDRIEGSATGIGNYQKDLRQGGASDWIGLAPLWDILYLYSMNERLQDASLSNADLAGRIPWNFREGDERAGTGHFFDAEGKVETFGRVISVNARQRVTLSDLKETCSEGAADNIQIGPVQETGWITTRDHMPDVAYIPYLFSGRYYYLEALQMQAAFIVGWKLGCTEESYNRQGREGFLHDTELRGDAWSFRTLTYAAFISPDGSPEKEYFEDKLLNNIAEWEGMHDVPLDIPQKRNEWNFGKTARRDARGVSPLGSWEDRGAEFVQPPVKPTAKGGASPWEENFLVNALGIARQFGYPTTALLQFCSRRLINQVLNPATSPEYVEAYRYPTSNAAGAWIAAWPEYSSYFDYKPKPGEWRTEETIDHSYGFIALAALSHLVPFSVDGYSGRAAWEFVRTHKPNRERLAKDSPKWALLPLETAPATTAEKNANSPDISEKAPKPESEEQASAGTVDGSARNAETRTSAPAASVVNSSDDPNGVGWHQIPNTKLASVCPPNTDQYAFRSNCMNVIAAWSGGIADEKRSRLIVWGGGHNDYFGNEVYALDLNEMKLTRLNDPSPLAPGAPPLPCIAELPDGKANTRHTYGGLSYIAHADLMYVFGGILACTNGGGTNDTWTLDLETLKWSRMDNSGNAKSQPRTINGVVMSDYDPNTNLVYMHNTRDFYSYDVRNNKYARLQFDGREVSYHMSAVIDPSRKLFVMFGGAPDGNGGVKVIRIGPKGGGSTMDWNSQAKGCEGLENSAYPGLAFDPVQKVIVGWAGGDRVYLFNPDTKSCSVTEFQGGPGPQQPDGTHGRFRYFEKLDVFAVVNSYDENAYLLRLRAAGNKSGTH